MKFKKNFSLIAVTVLLLLQCSCAKGESAMKIEISTSDKTLIDLATQIYDEHQLMKIIEFKGSLSELNSQYSIECLRVNNGIYRASYLGDGSIAVILFDDSGKKLWGKIYFTQLLKSDFEKLEKGQFLEEVRTIDPKGEYSFLYTGRNDIPKVSSHYTKDGYLIIIEYDALNTITSININLI